MNNDNLSLIQLNCRGINSKLGDIKIMIYTQKPQVVAFCETWLDKYVPKFVDYTCEWKNRISFAGGIGFLIRKGVQYQNVFLQPYAQGHLEFQAIKIKLSAGKLLYVLNIYNPGKPVTVEEMKHYIDQLENNYILVGDFNAHTKLLESRCVKANATGKAIERLVEDASICLCTPLDFFTYVSPATGKRSCLDLCLTTPELVPKVMVRQLQDVGSDHIPVAIRLEIKPIIVEKTFPKKWKVDDENIKEFARILENDENRLIKPASVEEVGMHLTEKIHRAAEASIKKTSGKSIKRLHNPWWSDDCNKAVAERRKARKQLEKFPSQENVEEYKKKSAAAKKICKERKNKSFHEFVEGITYDTPVGTVWKKLKALKAGGFNYDIPIELNGILITDPIEKANYLAKHFQKSARFGKHINIDDFNEKLIMASKEGSYADYNGEIILEELLYAVQSCKNKSAGIDEITNQLIKNLPECAMLELLDLINQSFCLGQVPDIWKVGVIIPILKAGKLNSSVTSYRPVTLLSCLCKIMERIIQRRLQYVVDCNGMINGCQYGFCKGESTIDVHVQLENIIRRCLESKEVCVVVYVDLSAAFDKVWHKGLITKLIDKGIRGRLILWLNNYLSNRRVKVRIDGHYSEEISLEAGTPQGGVLSPLLFNLMLSDLPDDDRIGKFVYADDITLTCCGKDLKLVKRKMQNYIQKLEKWMQMWGMVINASKTYMQYFTRRRIQYPLLKINNEIIKYKKYHKLLGIFYDSPLLRWKKHVDYLLIECSRRMDIMKAVASPNWGASSKVLRIFYISYIRAKLDYGAVLYSNAAKTSLEKLERLQNACCRMILGARKSTPVLSLQAEAFLPSLELHRGLMSAKLLIKLSYKLESRSILDKVTDRKYQADCYPVNSFMRRAIYWCELLDITLKRVYNKVTNDVPPWASKVDCIINYEDSTICNNQAFLDYVNIEFSDFNICFTDGSKGRGDHEGVGSAIYFPKLGVGCTYRLHPKHSVIFSELFAIRQALLYIEQNTYDSYVIFSDSKSSLQLVASDSVKYASIVGEIKGLLMRINVTRKVILHWVRGHSNITGNEIVDKLAKKAQENNRSVNSYILPEEIFVWIRENFLEYWNNDWKFNVNYTGKGLDLYNVRENIRQKIPIYEFKNRKYEKTIYRLRLGHAGLKKYLYRIGMADNAICEYCNDQSEETIEHYLLYCKGFHRYRRNMYNKLSKLKINCINLKVLLGADERYREKIKSIFVVLLKFIEDTNRMSEI